MFHQHVLHSAHIMIRLLLIISRDYVLSPVKIQNLFIKNVILFFIMKTSSWPEMTRNSSLNFARVCFLFALFRFIQVNNGYHKHDGIRELVVFGRNISLISTVKKMEYSCLVDWCFEWSSFADGYGNRKHHEYKQY
jgi:hypothetical protein